MTDMSDQIGGSSAQPYRAANKKTQRNQEKATAATAQNKETERQQLPRDKVEIGSAEQPTPLAKGVDQVEIRSRDLQKDIKKYTAMLMEMDDVREDEVQRVRQILEGDGYGEEVLPQLIDRLLEEG